MGARSGPRHYESITIVARQLFRMSNNPGIDVGSSRIGNL